MENKILRFAENMQLELNRNEGKGNWQLFLDRDNIIKELDYHLDKLDGAICLDNEDRIKEYIILPTVQIYC